MDLGQVVEWIRFSLVKNELVAILKNIKIIIQLLLAFTSMQICAQDSAYIKYENISKQLLLKIKSNTINEVEEKELKQIALGFQNYGQLIDETDHDYNKSLEYINKAIVLFVALKDTLSEANNRKFKGYLLGMLSIYAQAKDEIKVALDLYSLKKFPAGIAVSQFDLSRVYDQENKIDSSIYYCKTSLAYWKSIDRVSRIVNVQNMLIYLLIKKKGYKSAILIQKESESLINNNNLYWLDIIDFYFVSMQLYKASKETNSATLYHHLYQIKLNDLTKEGTDFKSYYKIIVN
jgi:hypothetical protein